MTITDNDAVDPADIDGDGVLNDDDPLAYDGQNGLGNVLSLGGSFRQDFDVDTSDPFSAEAGFTGILVNTVAGYTPPGTSGTDPYGDRTTDTASMSTAIIAGAEDGRVLKVVATETDTFGTGTGTNNTLKDNYLRGADVSGVGFFTAGDQGRQSVPDGDRREHRTCNMPVSGLHIGAGGTDDWVKLVFGVENSGIRFELAHNGSLTTGSEKSFIQPADPVENSVIPTDFILRLDVDKSGVEPTLVASAIAFDSDRGRDRYLCAADQGDQRLLSQPHSRATTR